ncbi:MAG: hypothetical protein E7672_07655 [Ruminococcaceae bacterium]|nr:hypothetical protein [Oscillospiraceae bacterium]
MPTSDNGKKSKIAGFFLWLVKTSLILSWLDRFAIYVHDLFKSGFFGYIFTGYKTSDRSYFSDKYKESKLNSHIAEFRYGVCRRIESSVIINGVSLMMSRLLACRLKVYGAFMASFGAYTAVVTTITAAIDGKLNEILDNPNIFIAFLFVVSSLAPVMSKKTLSEALCASIFGRFVLRITGFSEQDVKDSVGEGGHTHTAFVIGLICGALTYFVSPLYMIILIVAVPALYLVLIKPEIGVMALFFLTPFLETMVLAGIVIYTTLCYMIKLFRGKRVLRIEPIDITVIAFMVLTFFGGTISLSNASLKRALLMICFIFAYFLVSQLIYRREWLVRCTAACIVSALIISLYGIILYYLGGGYSSSAWLDKQMFSGIASRAVSTLENPNMLGEYLILIIPIAVASFISRWEGIKRFQLFFCIAAMGVCLILTWSRGAWLGLLIALLALVFIWHRRSMWLVIGGVASLPILFSIMPESIKYRITSIGDLADSSTSYRVYIWNATVEMIRDNVLSGIGIGEEAWDRIYPLYSLNGIEAAPHSHNLFLQIWLELGLFGLIVFLAVIFLIFQAGFTFLTKLSNNNIRISTAVISESIMKENMMNRSENEMYDVNGGKFCLKMSVAGSMCGLLAVLAQGMTDYIWYNNRLFLMFWLVCGLTVGYIKCGRSFIERPNDSFTNDSQKSETEIIITKNQKDKSIQEGRIDE